MTDIISIFLNYVETDLDYGECAWFAKELFEDGCRKILLSTRCPGNYNDWINGSDRYVTIYVDEWLEMINTYLNPFDTDIHRGQSGYISRETRPTGKIYSVKRSICG